MINRATLEYVYGDFTWNTSFQYQHKSKSLERLKLFHDAPAGRIAPPVHVDADRVNVEVCFPSLQARVPSDSFISRLVTSSWRRIWAISARCFICTFLYTVSLCFLSILSCLTWWFSTTQSGVSNCRKGWSTPFFLLHSAKLTDNCLFDVPDVLPS